jgi:hypothetical protein
LCIEVSHPNVDITVVQRLAVAVLEDWERYAD